MKLFKKKPKIDILKNTTERNSYEVNTVFSRKENEFGHLMPREEAFYEFIKDKDLEEYYQMEDIQEDYRPFLKRRLQKAIVAFIISCLILFAIAVIFHYSFYMPPILSLGIALLVYKIDFLRLKSKALNHRREVQDSFPIWMSTLEVLVMNYNIPQTLEKSYDSCPRAIKPELKKLIVKLQDNPIDKDAYGHFLSSYNLPEVQEIIMDLYQFNFLDKNTLPSEFLALHARLNRIKSNNRKRRQEMQTFLISALISTPLFLLAIYIMLVSNLLASLMIG